MGSLFRFLEPASYGGRQVKFGYDGEIHIIADGKELPMLDPIPKEIVGRAAILTMMATGENLGLTTIVNILCVARFPKGQAPGWLSRIRKQHMKGPHVRGMYEQHLDTLQNVTILEPVAQISALRWLSNYFAVLKTAITCRSIFNGKALSKATPPPPPVNLMSTADVVEAMASHVLKHKRLVIVECDLRHWFHQILVCDELSYLFGLLDSHGRYYRWRTLPMGWSWSPAIAQAASWALIMHRVAKGSGAQGGTQAALFDEEAFKCRSKVLPRWVDITGDRGKIFVYYDNIVALCDTVSTAEQVRARILSNALALHVSIKGTTEEDPMAGVRVWRPDQLLKEGVNILGIQVGLDGYRGSDRSYRMLRLRPAKLDEWATKLLPTSEMASCRELAEFVGRMIFAAMLESRRLHQTRIGLAALNYARRIGVEARLEGHWERKMRIPDGFADTWGEVMAQKARPIFIDVSVVAATGLPKWVIATDSSTAAWGFIVYDRTDMKAVDRHSGTWQADDRRHIFLKELDAALQALRYWTNLHPNDRVDLVIDNMGVVWALRNEYTRSTLGQKMIDEHASMLALVYQVIPIPGCDNPADVPSRPERKCDDEEEALLEGRLWTTVLAWYDGKCESSRPWTSIPRGEQNQWLRHEGPLDPEDAPYDEAPDEEDPLEQ
jgi:hypothetical protein